MEKKKFKKAGFLKYFTERLALNQVVVLDVIQEIKQAIPVWRELIQISFLSKKMKENYLHLLKERCDRLEW